MLTKTFLGGDYVNEKIKSGGLNGRPKKLHINMGSNANGYADYLLGVSEKPSEKRDVDYSSLHGHA